MTDPKQDRLVQCIAWTEGGAVLTATDAKRLVYRSEDHGDHNENWIVVIENEVETSRHNTRFIESIMWMPQTNTQ